MIILLIEEATALMYTYTYIIISSISELHFAAR